MNSISVLVVDDSAVVRTALRRMFASVPEVGRVEVAANGAIGLTKIRSIKPDIIILDLEMPEVDGREVLQTLKEEGNTIPVLVFSSVSERSARSVLDAMNLGAADFISKSFKGDLRTEAEERLIPLVLALATPTCEPAIPAPTAVSRPRKSAITSPISCVVIGASTGGPNALARVMTAFPADFEVPVLIVQHMPPVFTKQLAQRLDKCSNLTVREGSDGEAIAPGQAWLAPGGSHMVLHRAMNDVRIEINSNPRVHSCRPAVDPLFQSAAEIYGSHLLGSILTGMGSDGLEGCQAIKADGGRVLAQDRESSVVWGMPRFVTEEGLADGVLALEEIGPTIVRWVRESLSLKHESA